MKEEEVWWSAEEAAARAGCTAETIRNWGRAGIVTMKEVPGGRKRLRFLANDVLSHSGRSASPINASHEELVGLRAVNASLVDRNVVLEEVVRLYHLIDDRRDEIDRWHREIEELLQGTPPVPND